MLNTRFVIFLLLLGVVFVIYVMHIRKKHKNKPALSWQKLILEFWLASIALFISSLIFGLLGKNLIEDASWQVFAVLFLLIIPVAVGWLYYFYNQKMKRRFSPFDLFPCLVFNRFYEFMVLVNILYWIKSKIF